MPSLPPQAHEEPLGRTSLTASRRANCNKSDDSHPTARRIEHGRRDGQVAAPDGPETRVVNSSLKQAPGAEPWRLGETPAVWLDTDLQGCPPPRAPPSHPSCPLSIPPKKPQPNTTWRPPCTVRLHACKAASAVLLWRRRQVPSVSSFQLCSGCLLLLLLLPHLSTRLGYRGEGRRPGWRHIANKRRDGEADGTWRRRAGWDSLTHSLTSAAPRGEGLRVVSHSPYNGRAHIPTTSIHTHAFHKVMSC